MIMFPSFQANPAKRSIHRSNFTESVVPTHTFASPPEDLDVLFIPGGYGTRESINDLTEIVAYVKDVFPRLQYLITVCTGAAIAARAGALDGRYATTNKLAWFETIAHGPKTTWLPRARWVQDNSSTETPHVWTTSGVSAGIDGTVAWISHVYGDAVATRSTDGFEYFRQRDWQIDPFAGLYTLTEIVYPVSA